MILKAYIAISHQAPWVSNLGSVLWQLIRKEKILAPLNHLVIIKYSMHVTFLIQYPGSPQIVSRSNPYASSFVFIYISDNYPDFKINTRNCNYLIHCLNLYIMTLGSNTISSSFLLRNLNERLCLHCLYSIDKAGTQCQLHMPFRWHCIMTSH